MKWKDWYLEKTKGEKTKEEELLVEEKKSGYRVWEDLVTGTWYCIADGIYDTIWESGKERLEQCLKDNDLE